MREPRKNAPVQAANGRCVGCRYRLAWILAKGDKRRETRGGPARAWICEYKTLSLSIDLPTAIGLGSWHGRTLLIGNPRRCQTSILVVKRGPVASEFYPRR